MTEAEWNKCEHRDAMLEWLKSTDAGTSRKFLLWAIACCRRIVPMLTDERGQVALVIAEDLVEGRATRSEGNDAAKASSAASIECTRQAFNDVTRAQSAAYRAVTELVADWPSHLPHYQVAALAAAIAMSIKSPSAEEPLQCDLLRDMYGPLPFRSKTLDPSLLTWNFSTIPSLAASAYELRHLPSGTLDPCRLAVLADALEEAGCVDAELLGHFRGPGVHYRGCWGLDVILGKE